MHRFGHRVEALRPIEGDHPVAGVMLDQDGFFHGRLLPHAFAPVRFIPTVLDSHPSTPSWPGLSPQVGFTRLAALKNAQLGRARVAVPSTSFSQTIKKDVDARATQSSLRRLRKLVCAPAHDES